MQRVGRGAGRRKRLAFFNKIIQQVAEAGMIIGMLKGCGEDKR